MDTTVNVQDAKARLSDLMARAERGETVRIARAGNPAVELVPLNGQPRQLGFMALPPVPASFFDDLPADELAAWE